MSGTAPPRLFPNMKSYGVLFLALHKNGKVFVGRSVVGMEERWRQLVENALQDAGSTNPLYKAIRADGTDSFELSELSAAESQEELDDLEMEAFTTFNPTRAASGYNVPMFRSTLPKPRRPVERRRENPPTHRSNDLRLPTGQWRKRKPPSAKDFGGNGGAGQWIDENILGKPTFKDAYKGGGDDHHHHQEEPSGSPELSIDKLGQLTRHVAFVVTSLLAKADKTYTHRDLIRLYDKVARHETLGLGLSRYTIAAIAHTAAQLNGFHYPLVLKPRDGITQIDPERLEDFL